MVVESNEAPSANITNSTAWLSFSELGTKSSFGQNLLHGTIGYTSTPPFVDNDIGSPQPFCDFPPSPKESFARGPNACE
jgi:hypothetical protein